LRRGLPLLSHQSGLAILIGVLAVRILLLLARLLTAALLLARLLTRLLVLLTRILVVLVAHLWDLPCLR
jgi:hypothetical protein